MIPLFFSFFFVMGLFAESRDSYVYTTNRSSDEEENVEVTCKIINNKCTIVITKDGETKTITLPLDNLDDLEDFVEDPDIYEDIDIHRWIGPLEHRSDTWLGVYIQPMTDQQKEHFKVRGSDGVLVTEVVKDSPAEKAELKTGDVILSVDREEIEETDDLVEVIGEKEPGDEVSIRIVRDGRRKTVTVTLDSMAKQQQKRIRKFSYKFDEDFPSSLRSEHFPPDFHEELESLREELNELREELEQLKLERKPEE